MQGDSAYLPLWFCFVAALCTLPVALIWRDREIRSRPWQASLPVLGATFVAAYLSMAFAYASSPSFFDHFEPSITLGAERILRGEQAFPGPESAAQYASIYGPNAYLFNALCVAAWPEIIAGSKLAGTAAAFLFCFVFGLGCARRNGWRIGAIQLGYVIAGCLLFGQFGYWNRPEPLQLLGVALALLSLTVSAAAWQGVLIGVATALLMNLKIHSLLYVLPVIAELAHRGYWRVLFIGGAVCSAGLIAPFVFPALFSIEGYLGSLAGAATHSFSFDLFLKNLAGLLFFTLPVLFGKLCTRRSPKSPVDYGWVFALVLCLTSLLVCGIASKLGAGSHHLIPLLPLFAWALSAPLRTLFTAQTLRPLLVAMSVSWVGAILLCAFQSQQAVRTVLRNDHGSAIVANLRAIRTTYPQYTIQMGSGNPSQWFLYWYRPELRSQSPVDFLDITVWMDMLHAGRRLMPQTRQVISDERFDLWVIPKGGVPFTQVSFYPPYGDLFDDAWRASFNSHYRLVETSPFYDLYLANRIKELPTVERR